MNLVLLLIIFTKQLFYTNALTVYICMYIHLTIWILSCLKLVITYIGFWLKFKIQGIATPSVNFLRPETDIYDLRNCVK